MTTNEKRTAILAAMADACIAIDSLTGSDTATGLWRNEARGMVADCARQLRYFTPGTPEHNDELREGLDTVRDCARPADAFIDADTVNVEHFHVARLARLTRRSVAPTLRESGEWLMELADAGLLGLYAGGTLTAEFVVLASPVYPELHASYAANEKLRAAGAPGASFMGG